MYILNMSTTNDTGFTYFCQCFVRYKYIKIRLLSLPIYAIILIRYCLAVNFAPERGLAYGTNNLDSNHGFFDSCGNKEITRL